MFSCLFLYFVCQIIQNVVFSSNICENKAVKGESNAQCGKFDSVNWVKLRLLKLTIRNHIQWITTCLRFHVDPVWFVMEEHQHPTSYLLLILSISCDKVYLIIKTILISSFVFVIVLYYSVCFNTIINKCNLWLKQSSSKLFFNLYSYFSHLKQNYSNLYRKYVFCSVGCLRVPYTVFLLLFIIKSRKNEICFWLIHQNKLTSASGGNQAKRITGHRAFN